MSDRTNEIGNRPESLRFSHVVEIGLEDFVSHEARYLSYVFHQGVLGYLAIPPFLDGVDPSERVEKLLQFGAYCHRIMDSYGKTRDNFRLDGAISNSVFEAREAGLSDEEIRVFSESKVAELRDLFPDSEDTLLTSLTSEHENIQEQSRRGFFARHIGRTSTK